MKIIVAIKKALDYAARVRLSTDGKNVDLTGAKLSVNPFCEIALEQAIRIKEFRKPKPTEVIAVSCASFDMCNETLRTALALGVDRAIAVGVGKMRLDTELQPLAVAKLIKHITEKEQAQMILCGKQAIDSDSCQTAPMLASLLGWNQATFLSKLTVSDDGQRISIEREVEMGTDVMDMALPAVLSCDLRLNTPRFVSLPKLMKAKKMPIEAVEGLNIGIDSTPKVQVQSIEETDRNRKGQILNSVDELISVLKSEGKLSK